jgi:tetratricopeptide (TPR) repeat protein
MTTVLLLTGALALAADEFGDPNAPEGGLEPRQGAVDKQANGTPARGKVDDEAVSQLNHAEELLRDDKEPEAIAAALPLLPIFEKNEDFDHLVDALFIVGEAYYYQSDWANAEKYMARAADLGYRYYADEMSSYPLKVVGESQWEQKQPDKALATFRQRVQILRKQEDTEELPGALFDVGGMLVNLGQLDEAIAMLEDARKANETKVAALPADDDEGQQGALVDQGEITYHMGIAYFQKEDMKSASRWLMEALAAFDKLGPAMADEVSDRIVSVLDDLVLVSENLGDTAAAEQYRKRRDSLNH